MNKDMAEHIAENIIKQVVDMIADRRYEQLDNIAELDALTAEDIKELAEGYLELNELSCIDHFDMECNFHPRYEYQQLNFYHYNNGSGMAADYDMTTDGELNDLTLQMEFLYEGTEGLKAKILDLHVM